MQEVVQEASANTVISTVASKATYGGAAASVFGWLASSEAGVVFGVLLGVIGLLVNVWFKFREDKRQELRQQIEDEARVRHEQRQQVEHEARLRAIQGEYP